MSKNDDINYLSVSLLLVINNIKSLRTLINELALNDDWSPRYIKYCYLSMSLATKI